MYGWLCPGGELFDLTTHAMNFFLSVSTCFYATLKILLEYVNGRMAWREERSKSVSDPE